MRLTGCNIRCTYCDQPEALERRPGTCRLETTAGAARLAHRGQSAGDRRARRRRGRALATGPPPLDQPHRGRAPAAGHTGSSGWSSGWPVHGWPVMLETNGTLVPALRRVLSAPRLREHGPQAAQRRRRGRGPDAQAEFLGESLAAGATTWVKVVVGPTPTSASSTGPCAMVAEASAAAGVGPSRCSSSHSPPSGQRPGAHARTGARSAGPGTAHPSAGAGGAPDPQGHRAAVSTGRARPDPSHRTSPESARGRTGARPRPPPGDGTTWPWRSSAPGPGRSRPS